MMASYIDRNGEQMMRFSKDAQTVIGEMVLIIRKIEGVLDSYAPDLDTPSQRQIEKLHVCCNSYLKEIEVYQQVADTIFRMGKKIDDVRKGGH